VYKKRVFLFVINNRGAGGDGNSGGGNGGGGNMSLSCPQVPIGCVQQKCCICNCCKIRKSDWCMLILTESKSIPIRFTNFTTVANSTLLLNAAIAFVNYLSRHGRTLITHGASTDISSPR